MSIYGSAWKPALAPHRVEFTWVRGHAGHPENERADALARAAIDDRAGRDAGSD